MDLAILFRDEKSARKDELHLATVDSFLVGAAGDELTAAATIAFARLDRIPLVLPSRPSAWRHLLDEVARRKGITLDVVLEANSITIQKEVVAKGKTYTLLGPYAMQDELRVGRLQAARIVTPELKRFVTLAMPTKGPLTFARKVIAELIRGTANDLERQDNLSLGRRTSRASASRSGAQSRARTERGPKAT